MMDTLRDKLHISDEITLVIFDVDGTLVTTKSGATFRQNAQDWQWLDGRMGKMALLHLCNVSIALASNQSGVAFPWSKFSEAEIKAELMAMGGLIGAYFVAVCCTTPNEKALPAYRNDNDPRRKPGPGMVQEAMAHYGATPAQTVMVGDRAEDEGAALAAGCRFLWAEEFFQ